MLRHEHGSQGHQGRQRRSSALFSCMFGTKTSKNTLKSGRFSLKARKTIKCAGLFGKMGRFRKNPSKDLHYCFRIRHVAAFLSKDLQFRFRIRYVAALFPKKLRTILHDHLLHYLGGNWSCPEEYRIKRVPPETYERTTSHSIAKADGEVLFSRKKSALSGAGNSQRLFWDGLFLYFSQLEITS